MALSLGELAATESLPVLAGAAGLDRVIGWVHPTELVDPTAFLDGGELLLTTGLAFDPASADPAPVPDTAGESGLALAAGAPAPAAAVESGPAPDVAGDSGLALAAGDSAAAAAVESGLAPGAAGESGLALAAGDSVPAVAVESSAAPATAGAAYAAYVERLVAAGVAGIGFGSGVIHERVPPGLVAAAEAAGLPLLEVPREVPFIAITKAVSAAVAADEYATVVRTGRGQQELTRAAVGRGGPGALVRRLARLIGGWVLLLDSANPVEAAPASARGFAADLSVSGLRGTRGARLPSGDEVVLHSLGSRTVLAVGRSSPLDAADQYIVNTAASLLSLALQRNREQSGVLAGLRSGLLELLVSQEDLGVPAIQGLFPGLPSPPWQVLVVVGPAAALTALADSLDDTFHVVRESDVVLLAPDVDEVAPVVRRLGLHAGLSSPSSGAATALRQATQAAQAARSQREPWLTFDEYTGSGLLALLPDESSALFANTLLSPLSADLIEALRCWLEEHGHYDAAATRLGIHRHTLRNRLRKVEALTGRSLASPGTRAEFWVALSVTDR